MISLPSFIKSFTAVLVVLLSLLQASAASAAVVDIMLVYDSTATAWVSGNGGKDAFSADAVNRMNQALQNSGLGAHSFRLVHSMSVNYATISLNDDLKALQQGGGAFASVHTARTTYAADLVAMLVDTGSAYGSVGLGYIMSSWSGLPNYGFAVCAIRSVDISNTLTHEVGHNLGADHANDQLSDPGPNPNLDNQYSAGYYFTGTDDYDYHTIMAYNSDGYGGHYNPAPLFSTPLKTYRGAAAGNAQFADNARLIGQTIGTVANYRVPVTLTGLSITGPDTVSENGSAAYSATAYWSDGSSGAVSPVWSENSGYATIDASGVLSVGYLPSDQSVTVSATYSVNSGSVSASYSVTLKKVHTLATAVGAPSLTIVTGGDADWFIQTATSQGGGIAIRSGDIGDNQQSYVRTTIWGPGTLQFYWMNSSAPGDYLSFHIDDVEQPGKISGGTNWALMTFQIPEGTHRLKWVYSKNSSFSWGYDCGWVDSISFVWQPPQNPTRPGAAAVLPVISNMLLGDE